MSKIIQSFKAVDTTDGDGVKLKRVFGYYQKEIFDPFLMLDHAKTSYPQSGFPWHPHRGIETITYLIKGKAFHEDSLGNKGELNDGDVQWMKAGSGILHQEFPDSHSSDFEMLQFWLNMPSTEKMTEPEYVYTNVLNSNIIDLGKTKISVIAGEYRNVKGPVQKPTRKVSMYYIKMQIGQTLELSRELGTNAFLYVLKGNAQIDKDVIEEYNIYKLREEDFVIKSESDVVLIYAEGVPLKESIEWYGPIVMNTKEQIRTARRELQEGTFLKTKQ